MKSYKLTRRQWKNLWSSYRWKMRQVGMAQALVWIDGFSSCDADLLAQLVCTIE